LGNNVLVAAVLNRDYALRDVRAFPQVREISLFATKGAFLHLENFDLQDLFLLEIIQFSHGKNARCWSFKHR
jgi:hypothetical protein